MRGFILQPGFRVEAGRPVVVLQGVLETGEPFLLRDDRQRPAFWIASEDAARAADAGAPAPVPTELVTLDGRAAARLDLRLPGDARPLRDRLRQRDVVGYEADVRFATRFLIRHGLRGALKITGESTTRPGVGRVFENPDVAPARYRPRLQVLSFDIETDPKARHLLSIGLYSRGPGGQGEDGVAEVLLLTPEGHEAPPGAVPFASERELLAGFCERVRAIDPDVLTGWNVVDFDFRVLVGLARRLRLPFELGRGPGAVRIRDARTAWASREALVPGRVVLDGIALLRSSFVKMDEHSLDAVARRVLGEGKLITGHDRAGDILDAFHHDRPKLVAYNLADARLVIDILGELRLVELAVERSLLTGLPIDRVAGAVAAFDFLYLSELGRRGVVAPSVGEGRHRTAAAAAANYGGYVLEPEPGLYENVLVCDFKSLYPSVVRTFQIDPLGYLEDPADDDPILAPNGAAFRRGRGILPGLVDELMPCREAAKAAGDKVASHAIKILMNSFYGVLGTSACRFHRPEVAGAITAFGREILLWSKRQLESYGVRVLYGDTDSLFLLSGEDDPAAALALGERLVARLNTDLAAHVASTWRVESRLELELERLYRKLLLHHVRRGRGGARKRYAGLVGEGEAAEVVLTGLEAVRSDWTELAKGVQRELYERLFADRQVEAYLHGVVKDLRAGLLDDRLVYRKALRKRLQDYTATTPPHVAAARKMRGRVGRRIDYVMTVSGAEPAAERTSALDYEHYVEKQVRPVAEPVLEILGLRFDKVIGDDAQLELFAGWQASP